MLHTAPIILLSSVSYLVFCYFCLFSNRVGSNEVELTFSSCYSRATTLAMETHEVVPDVIDVVPPKSIQVKYPSGVEVKQGNELTPTQVKDQPELNFDAEPGALYTLIMSDPDAPSRAKPDFREILHWLIINIPGNDISKGDTKASYIGSGPPKDSGLHRYIFLVFKQPGPLKCTEPGMETGKLAREQRRKFNVRNFAKKYNLGQPIAGNFYQAQYDDYVPILHAQLK